MQDDMRFTMANDLGMLGVVHYALHSLTPCHAEANRQLLEASIPVFDTAGKAQARSCPSHILGVTRES